MVLQAGFRADRRPREFFGPRLWKPPIGDKAKFLGGGHSPLLCFEPWWYESWYGTMPAFASINVGDTTLCIFTKKWRQHQESDLVSPVLRFWHYWEEEMFYPLPRSKDTTLFLRRPKPLKYYGNNSK